MTYAIPVQCLRLPSASSCRHPQWELEARGLSPWQLARRACQDPVISKTVHRPKLEKRITMKS